MLSRRTKWNLTKNKISQLLDIKRKNKIPILDFTESNPTQCRFSYPEKKILDALYQSINLSYVPHPKGMLAARETIARYYRNKSKTIHTDQIFLLSSTSEGYSYLFRLLADPGDYLLVPRPGYPLFDMLATLNDIQLQYYDLIYQRDWIIDIQSIEKNIGHRTKAILLVNPNNPTGSFIKMNERKSLLDICQKHELALISDEVFSDSFYPESQDLWNSFVDIGQVLTFTLNGISKMLALPQMKLAWLYCNGPKNILGEVITRLELMNDCYLSVNTPIQNALPQLMLLHHSLQESILTRVLANRRFLHNEITHFPGVCLLNSEGGWYSIIQTPQNIDEEKFTLYLLDTENILLYPGYFYEFPGNGFFVLSLLLPHVTFCQGIQRILSALSQFNPSQK